MITEIGIVAGEIWHFLDKTGEVSLPQLLKELDKPKEIVLMSLGWLVREGYVQVRKEQDQYKIKLR